MTDLLSPEWEPYVEAAARAIFDSWKLSPSDEAGWDDCVRTARVALAAALDLVPTTECETCGGNVVAPCTDEGCGETRPHGHGLCPDCVDGRVSDGTRLLLVRQVEAEINDLGQCPYLDRWYGVEGHDPEATCAFGCVDEPECMTCEPDGGWPSRLTLYVALSEEQETAQ